MRAHSGWAAVVAIRVRSTAVEVVDRRRIELTEANVRGFPQPYHAAESLPFAEAGRLIAGCMEAADRRAEAGLRGMLDTLNQGAVICGLVTSSARQLPGLHAVLKSHALIHTAEGEMYRQALRNAAERLGLEVHTLRERDAYTVAAELLGKSEEAMRQAIADLGTELGPPWREDQKLATLAAWCAICTK